MLPVLALREGDSVTDYGPYMDDGMVEWCDRLNAIPHVVTLQSCAGHPEGERSKTGGIGPYGASLWFRADFDFDAEMLADDPSIDQVAHLFGRDREPLWEVLFDGRNKSEEHFQRGVRAIFHALLGAIGAPDELMQRLAAADPVVLSTEQGEAR